jgi:hypothetical protein
MQTKTHFEFFFFFLVIPLFYLQFHLVAHSFTLLESQGEKIVPGFSYGQTLTIRASLSPSKFPPGTGGLNTSSLGGGFSGRGEKVGKECGRMKTVQKLCNMYVNAKMRPVVTIPGVGEVDKGE